jgi:hypothetical protein
LYHQNFYSGWKDEKIDETAQAAASDNLVNAFDPNSVVAGAAAAGAPQV